MIEVEDLDPAGVLARIADAERRDREVQREKRSWPIMVRRTRHRDGYGDVGRRGSARPPTATSGWVRRRPGSDSVRSRGMGAAMGASTQSAMPLMATPWISPPTHRLWSKMKDLAVAQWKTRRVATDTRSLPFEAARSVDEQLASRVDGFGLPTIERGVALRRPVAPESRPRRTRYPVPAPRHPHPPASRRVRRHLLARGRR